MTQKLFRETLHSWYDIIFLLHSTVLQHGCNKCKEDLCFVSTRIHFRTWPRHVTFILVPSMVTHTWNLCSTFRWIHLNKHLSTCHLFDSEGIVNVCRSTSRVTYSHKTPPSICCGPIADFRRWWVPMIAILSLTISNEFCNRNTITHV